MVRPSRKDPAQIMAIVNDRVKKNVVDLSLEYKISEAEILRQCVRRALPAVRRALAAETRRNGSHIDEPTA